MKKPIMIYTPPSIINLAEQIKQKKGLKKRVDAFNHLAKYAEVGIEAENIYKLDFRNIIKKMRSK